MGKFIDLTGNKIGSWTVISRVENKGKARRWLCKCDCGTVKDVAGTSLSYGDSVSCGCSKIGSINVKDLTGNRFGKLVVTKQASNGKSGVRWWCQCDCGSDAVIRTAGALGSGKAISCGCINKNVIDLKGQIFGKLTVLKRDRNTTRGVMWLCRCECGNKKVVASSDFHCDNPTQSCGCSQYNGIISYTLENRYIGFDAALYDFANHQISFAEHTRRDPLNSKVLQVRCALCNKWFTPTRSQVRNRIDGINGVVYKDIRRSGGSRVASEGRFYCSDGCKHSCPIYGQRLWPKGFKKSDYRNEILDPDLNNLVLNRDSYHCQKCGATEDLHVHHIEGVAQSPMTANDIDNCITVCATCHGYIHSQPGCTYQDYQREACEQPEA